MIARMSLRDRPRMPRRCATYATDNNDETRRQAGPETQHQPHPTDNGSARNSSSGDQACRPSQHRPPAGSIPLLADGLARTRPRSTETSAGDTAMPAHRRPASMNPAPIRSRASDNRTARTRPRRRDTAKRCGVEQLSWPRCRATAALPSTPCSGPGVLVRCRPPSCPCRRRIQDARAPKATTPTSSSFHLQQEHRSPRTGPSWRQPPPRRR